MPNGCHRLRLFYAVACLLALVATGACTTSAPRLDVEVETCCEAQFERYDTYSLTMEEMPGFLEPYLRGGIGTVLAEKGLRSTQDQPDLRVVLRFNQVFLDPESAVVESMGEAVAPDDSTRFMAAVSVDMFDRRNERLVWSGRLSRLHSNPMGQPRGNDHKMQGIIDGFGELFADYPKRLVGDNPEQ